MLILISLPVIGLGMANEVKIEFSWGGSEKDFLTFKRNALRKMVRFYALDTTVWRSDAGSCYSHFATIKGQTWAQKPIL